MPRSTGVYAPCCFSGLLVVGLSLCASAQTATVVGTITDPSGSVVPNVTVTATHVETGQVRTTKASDAGQYLFADLPIGHYSIKAEASGFGVAQKNDIVLNVGDRARIDFDLKMGAATRDHYGGSRFRKSANGTRRSQFRHYRPADHPARHQRTQHVLSGQPDAGSFQRSGRLSDPHAGRRRRRHEL